MPAQNAMLVKVGPSTSARISWEPYEMQRVHPKPVKLEIHGDPDVSLAEGLDPKVMQAIGLCLVVAAANAQGSQLPPIGSRWRVDRENGDVLYVVGTTRTPEGWSIAWRWTHKPDHAVNFSTWHKGWRRRFGDAVMIDILPIEPK